MTGPMEMRVRDKRTGQVAILEDFQTVEPVQARGRTKLLALLYYGTQNKQPVRRWVPMSSVERIDSQEVLLP